MKNFFRFLSLAAFLCLVLIPARPLEAASATLYLAPSSGSYVIGNNFSVAVKLNTGGAAVNAAQGAISFDKDVLKVVSISTGGSIFSLWTSQPAFNNAGGTISFAGGIPHPGYTGSAGTICTVTFQSLKVGTGGVRFTSGFALANDGKGTNILSTMGSGSYTVSPKSEAPKPDPKQEKPGEIVPKKEEPQAAYNKPKVVSETHPDENKWFTGDKVKFSWELPSGVEGVSLSFNDQETGDPGSKSDGIINSKEYAIEKDGHWYLHIKFQDEKGRWGTVTNFRINSDRTPPKAFEIKAVQTENDWPKLEFSTTDDSSGVDRYEVIVDDLQTEPKVLLADQTGLKIENKAIGEHTAIVKAFDRANNEFSATVKFSVDTIATPEIKNYTGELAPGKEFFVSGTAVSNSAVSVYIQSGTAEPEKYDTASDASGNWFLVVKNDFSKGDYTVWVKTVNEKGLPSKESPKVNFSVVQPVYSKVGSFVTNYFTLLVSLLFMVILIVILLVFLVELIRKRLKKETLEIEEVLERNLSNAKKLIEMELNSVRMRKEDQINLREELGRKLDEAKGGILKEIRDVEKILK